MLKRIRSLSYISYIFTHFTRNWSFWDKYIILNMLRDIKYIIFLLIWYHSLPDSSPPHFFFLTPLTLIPNPMRKQCFQNQTKLASIQEPSTNSIQFITKTTWNGNQQKVEKHITRNQKALWSVFCSFTWFSTVLNPPNSFFFLFSFLFYSCVWSPSSPLMPTLPLLHGLRCCLGVGIFAMVCSSTSDHQLHRHGFQGVSVFQLFLFLKIPFGFLLLCSILIEFLWYGSNLGIGCSLASAWSSFLCGSSESVSIILLSLFQFCNISSFEIIWVSMQWVSLLASVLTLFSSQASNLIEFPKSYINETYFISGFNMSEFFSSFSLEIMFLSWWVRFGWLSNLKQFT